MSAEATPKEFTLTVVGRNVSEMKDGEIVIGPQVEQFNIPWRLAFHRKNSFLAVYVYCESSKFETEWAIPVKVEFTLTTINGRKSRLLTMGIFSNSPDKRGYGITELINWADFEKIYLINDQFILDAKVEILDSFGVGEKKKLIDFGDEKATEMCDVTLVVGDHKFFVSKSLLVNQSSFFKTLFLGQFEESKMAEVPLKEIDPEHFQCFLELIYHESSLTDSCIEGVLHISDMYDAKKMIVVCEDFLIHKSKMPLKKKLEISVMFNLEQLRKFCFSEMKSSADVRSAMESEIYDKSVLKELLEKSLSFE